MRVTLLCSDYLLGKNGRLLGKDEARMPAGTMHTLHKYVSTLLCVVVVKRRMLTLPFWAGTTENPAVSHRSNVMRAEEIGVKIYRVRINDFVRSPHLPCAVL